MAINVECNIVSTF